MQKSSKIQPVAVFGMLLAFFFFATYFAVVSVDVVVKNFTCGRYCTNYIPPLKNSFIFYLAYAFQFLMFCASVFIFQSFFGQIIYDSKIIKAYSPLYSIKLNISDIVLIYSSVTTKGALVYRIKTKSGKQIQIGRLFVGSQFIFELIQHLVLVNPEIEVSKKILAQFGYTNKSQFADHIPRLS